MTNEEAAAAIKNGDIFLLPVLWKQTEQWIRAKAKDYYSSHTELCTAAGVALDDLEQEGYFAMLEAVKYYREEAGYTFLTFLRYPLQTAFNACCGMRTARGRGNLLNRAESLYKPIDGEEEVLLLDTVADEAAQEGFQSAEAVLWNNELHKDLEICLKRLPEATEAILRAKYYNGSSLQEIAAQRGITAAQAARKENEGLRDLRRGKNRLLLERYREDIISTHAYKGSFRIWERTRTSSVEYTVLKLEEKGGIKPDTPNLGGLLEWTP